MWNGAWRIRKRGVAALLRIVERPAETLIEKLAKTLLRAGEIFVGIERAEDVVPLHAAIEAGDEALETVFADEGVNAGVE